MEDKQFHDTYHDMAMTWQHYTDCFKFYQVDILIHLNDSFIIMCSPDIYDINISLQAVHFVKDFNFGN